MNYKRFLFLIVLFVSCLADLQASVSIVPIPNQITWNNGVYKLKQTVSISYSSDHLKSAALYLAENLHSVLGVK
jgi:opacity protein-like surface antigen